MKNLISIKGLQKIGVERVLEESERMVPYAKNGKIFPLKFKTGFATPKVCVLALEKSHRTAGSFYNASKLIGLDPERLNEDDTSIPKNETFGRTIRMLLIQGYSILVIRTHYEGGPKYAIEVVKRSGYNAPIVNAGDGRNHHPSQTLLDLFTIKRKFGGLGKNLAIALYGDIVNSRVAHGLFQAARMFDFRIGLFSDASIPSYWLKDVRTVEITDSLKELHQCQIFYALRPQFERMSPTEIQIWLNSNRRLTPAFLDAHCHPRVVILHAQPIDKGQDSIKLFPGLDYDPRFRAIDEQASNGMPIRMFLLADAFKNMNRQEELPEPKFNLKTRSYELISSRLKKKQYKIFRPIKTGTVIDHLPALKGRVIDLLISKMGFPEGTGLVARGIESKSHGTKDVIVLEEMFLPPLVLASIALLAPDATFNELKNGRIAKLHIEGNLYDIPASFPCPNPDCISNNDPECQQKFSAQNIEGERIITCSWCEREFNIEEIWRNIKTKF